MNNYYEYCKHISKSYYPKIYIDIKEHIDLELKNIDKDKIHPFPRGVYFQEIVDRIYESYKKTIYNKLVNGEISYINFTNEDFINLTKDLIKIMLIQTIITDRECFSDYPFYY